MTVNRVETQKHILKILGRFAPDAVQGKGGKEFAESLLIKLFPDVEKQRELRCSFVFVRSFSFRVSFVFLCPFFFRFQAPFFFRFFSVRHPSHTSSTVVLIVFLSFFFYRFLFVFNNSVIVFRRAGGPKK